MTGHDQAPLRVVLLGPVQVWRGERELDIGPPQRQAVLAVLAMAAGKMMSRHELIDAVWDEPPANVDSSLNSYISRLRHKLEPGHDRRGGAVLAHSGPGYVLRAEPGQVDALVFTDQVAAARQARQAGDPAAAARLLEGALALWQGDALAGIGGQWAQAQRTRLNEARLSALEERAEVKLALGCHAEMIAELTGLTGKYPLQEGLRGLLMVALYQSGRQAEALAVYHDVRQVLNAELGIEPGPGLRRLQERILAGDPALAPAGPGLASAGPASSPMAARPGVVPRELPADVSAFTGRAAELAELDALLPVAPAGSDGAAGPVVISAVAGTAGVGKTALAVRWAHQVAARFPDGQVYLNLRGYDPGEPMAAAEALAQLLRALGVPGPDIPLEEAELAARYRSAAAGRRLLVVLDNAATADQVRPLLPGTGTAMVVITSRDALAGLVAFNGAHRLELGLLPTADAVALLRALIGERVDADPVSAEALVGLCTGLPLALRIAAELAVSRPDTPLAGLVAELMGLPERLAWLDPGGDSRGAVASVFSWSYRHLPPAAARMFRLLGGHPGPGFDQHAAAALAATSTAQAAQLLGGLARAHLIQPAGSGRFGMHDLLRRYAVGLATTHDGGQAQVALTRLFDYYLAACAAAMGTLFPAEQHRRPRSAAVGSQPAGNAAPDLHDRAAARAWLDAELATLAVVAGYTASHGWPGHTISLAATLAGYLDGGHLTESLAIYSHGLNAARSCGDRAAEAHALTNMARVHRRQGRYPQSATCLEQALAVARDTGDRPGQAEALVNLAAISFAQGRYEHALGHCQQALSLFRELADQAGEAGALTSLGLVHAAQGRYQEAEGYHRLAVEVARKAGHRFREATGLINLSCACYWLGDYRHAAEHGQRALMLAREAGSRYLETYALISLAATRRRQGSYRQAAEDCQQAVALAREIGDPEGEADALNTTGEFQLATGQPGQAQASLAAALRLAVLTGNRGEQARALARLGQACHQQGHHEEAAAYHRQALAIFRQTGDRGGEADVRNGTGETLLATGQPGLARDSHAAALRLAVHTGDRYQQARAHHGLARACHATRHPTEAQQHWRHALDIYTGLGVPEATQLRLESHGDPGPGPESGAGPAPGGN